MVYSAQNPQSEDLLSAQPVQPEPVQDLTHLEEVHRAFNKALAAFQANCVAARKDGRNNHLRSTYSTLASVIEATKAACEYGLSHTQTTEVHADQLLLVTTLRHADGYEVRSQLPLPAISDWQKFGSAFTYARRYSLLAIYGLPAANEDDDGNLASAADSKRQMAAPPVEPPPAMAEEVTAVIEAMKALQKDSPDDLASLVEEFKTTFGLAPKASVARSLNKPEHVAWLASRLGLSDSKPQPNNAGSA